MFQMKLLAKLVQQIVSRVQSLQRELDLIIPRETVEFSVPVPFSFVIKVCAKIENTLLKGDSVIILHLFGALGKCVQCKQKSGKGTVCPILLVSLCQFIYVVYII